MLNIFIKKYNYTPIISVLKNIQITLEEGAISSIIGRSGSGKSTLLRILMGLELGAEGFVQDNNKIYNFDQWKSTQEIFSLMPQSSMLLPWKTIQDNILLASSKRLSKNGDKNCVENLLKIVNLENYANKYPSEISIGMAQRVSFCRALMQKKIGVLFDEPFASIDAYTRRLLQHWLRDSIAQTKNYALLVTHDIHEAIFISKTIHIISKTPAEICASYEKINDKSFKNLKTNQVFNPEELENEIYFFLQKS